MRPHTIWDEMKRMQERMDSLFDNFLGNEYTNDYLLDAPRQKDLTTSDYRQPISDVWETDNEVIAELELPGLNKDDIKINVDENNVEIKAETKNEKEDKDKKGMYRFERSYTGFYRNIPLPSSINSDKTEAEYKDGILKIKMPKLELEQQKRKQISIK